jgi:hypothetical protein
MYAGQIDLATLVLSLISISLPLSAIWASVSLENNAPSKAPAKPKPIILSRSYAVTSGKSTKDKDTMSSHVSGDSLLASSPHFEKDLEGHGH